jgi:bla regulator protein blaR1
VVDRTGLAGNWEFTLTFATEQRGPPPSGELRTDGSAPDPNAPSLFTALQEQPGLRLESTKGPVDVVVIDAIERPVED